ncbi:NAD-dependent epimerase/dehydratase family protein [Planctomicrobium sp. SH527]|uniref:NAD-dependent epimerase/dehydratase family protein n=1 Tax=Planctomicrobium sp. SH527 TaxID=3448123 RepID=UPI003F5B8BEE
MAHPDSESLDISNEEQLDHWLTTPSEELVRFMGTLTGNLLILGAGGKMGPTLAILAQRAATQAGSSVKVIAASRFSDSKSKQVLNDNGVETVSVDLLDQASVERLPDADNILFLVGSKFGTSTNPAPTWAANTIVPAYVMQRFPKARFVALSTGNVYPLTPIEKGGSVETDTLGPAGEYGQAALGRERIFQYYSAANGTKVVLIRLNYAVDLRYGVLIDIATQVFAGQPIDLTNGYLNCIWQGDANSAIIRSLDLAESPPAVLNLTGTETLSVRKLAEEFGRLLNREVRFTGEEAPSALLSNSSELCRHLGTPQTSLQTVIQQTAEWVRREGRLLNKPTHFEVRDGVY